MPTLEKKVVHSDTCSRVFKNYDKTCPRCIELSNGAASRSGWGQNRRLKDEQRIQAIRSHDCKKSGCMSVCVAFDW